MGLISRVSSRTYRKGQKKHGPTNNMGRVRTKTVKKASRRIIEKYYTKLGLDFYTNARIVDEVAIVPTKHLKNQIAGFITHTMKRIQKGPVRGISIKLQEEERERRTTTFQNNPLFANHLSSTIPPPRCSKLSTSKSMKPRTKFNFSSSWFKKIFRMFSINFSSIMF